MSSTVLPIQNSKNNNSIILSYIKTIIISTDISVLSRSFPSRMLSSEPSLGPTFIQFIDKHNAPINKKLTVTSEVPLENHYGHTISINSYEIIWNASIVPSVLTTISQSHKCTWVPTLVSNVRTTNYPSQDSEKNLSGMSYKVTSVKLFLVVSILHCMSLWGLHPEIQVFWKALYHTTIMLQYTTSSWFILQQLIKPRLL